METKNPSLDSLKEHLLYLQEHGDLRHLRLSRSAQKGLSILIEQAKAPKPKPGVAPATAAVSTPKPASVSIPQPTAPTSAPQPQPRPALEAAPMKTAKPSVSPVASSPLVSPEPAPSPQKPAANMGSSVTLVQGSKQEQMEHLRSRAVACTKCPHLVARRTQVVFGTGSLDAQLMFVGEAPGEEEDKKGIPFVGRAGELLTKMILAMGLTRDEIYIGNVVKCRPDMPVGVPGNRKPTREEMDTCVPYLHAQISLIAPKAIVALGATSVQGLTNTVLPIGQLRGKFLDYRGIPVMPTYHPSYLLRKQQDLVEKRKVWEDLLQVMEKLQLAISEKQRNYFLK